MNKRRGDDGSRRISITAAPEALALRRQPVATAPRATGTSASHARRSISAIPNAVGHHAN
ncbi:hypothetical protein LJR038_003549 [Acidovorax sp. LjRoot38]|uniref:hypothetical protein n=1 Tax=Acidovorax sp. LjRoot38 TaxID=3342327 RepID=UPI003ECD65FE